MSALGIFIYGAAVSAIVLTALGLLAWGILKERRDRQDADQSREVFGARTAAYLARGED